jgi:hypothetical protein
VHAAQLTDPEAKHIMLGIIDSYLKLARSAKKHQLSARPNDKVVATAE